MILVAKKKKYIYIYISVLQLFISRMPKMCAILQLVSAPYSIYIAHFLFIHIFKCAVQHCTHSLRTATTPGTSCPILFE